jgi:hypothetical protein
MEIPSTFFRYVFFMTIYFINYIYVEEKFNIMKNKILMKEGTMQVPSQLHLHVYIQNIISLINLSSSYLATN